MPSAFGDLSGPGNQQIWIDVARTGQDWGANRTDYRGEVRYYGNGYGSWGGSWGWEADFGGHRVSGRFSIPQSERYQQYHTLWSGSWSRFNDSEGWSGGFYCSAWIDTDHSSVGDGGASTNEETAPRIPQVPAAPSAMSVRAGTALPTSFGVDYTRGDNRGAGIEEDQIIWRRVSDGVDAWDDRGAAGYSNPEGIVQLVPGTLYDVFARSRNVRGWGNWAGPVRGETLTGGRAYVDGAWKNCRVRYWNGNAWQNCRVRTFNGQAWVNTR